MTETHMRPHRNPCVTTPKTFITFLHSCIQLVEATFLPAAAWHLRVNSRWSLSHLAEGVQLTPVRQRRSRISYCQDPPLSLAYVGDKKVKRFHFSEIIGRLLYVRATVTHTHLSRPQKPHLVTRKIYDIPPVQKRNPNCSV
jgi:hypothetical protein